MSNHISVTSSSKELIFTGGETLSGQEKAYHEAMMQNELQNGSGAYKLSYAGKSNSGPSFGGNQMDIGQNIEAREILFKIIFSSKDSKGEFIFTINEKEALKNKLLGVNIKATDFQRKTPEQVFGKYLPRINQALSSEYGIKRINEEYVKEIKTRGVYIDSIINRITNPAAKKFYSTTYGKTLLFDYHNQYNLSPNGKLMKHMNSLKIGKYTSDNHKEYIIKKTDYGLKNKRDANRRLSNIENLIKDYTSLDNKYDGY